MLQDMESTMPLEASHLAVVLRLMRYKLDAETGIMPRNCTGLSVNYEELALSGQRQG